MCLGSLLVCECVDEKEGEVVGILSDPHKSSDVAGASNFREKCTLQWLLVQRPLVCARPE